MDIVKELQAAAEDNQMSPRHVLVGDAAYEINKLRKENRRLRKALRMLSEFDANPFGSGAAYGQCGEMVRLARSAIQQKESE